MTKRLPVRVVSGKSHVAVPFKTLAEAEGFVQELAQSCPEIVYQIEYEDHNEDRA
jgi:hypothetical protein